jgi:hypothetical protein
MAAEYVLWHTANVTRIPAGYRLTVLLTPTVTWRVFDEARQDLVERLEALTSSTIVQLSQSAAENASFPQMAFVTDDNLFDVQPENLRASVEAAFASATETVAREREFEQSTGKEWLERLRS